MATYLILNCVFLAMVIIALRVKIGRPSKSILITLAILLALTAIFDSVIIGLGIVAYNTDTILGLYIGLAPIEDFFYAILAVIVVPTLWNGITLKKETHGVK